MATPNDFRDRFDKDVADEREKIDNVLVSPATPYVVGGIILVAIVWSIVSTFL